MNKATAKPTKPAPTPSQRQQIDRALHLLLDAGRPTVTFAGPAGSGKSFCLLAILEALEAAGKSIQVVAPTGKAARRASAATGRPTRTIHSWLFKSVMDDEDDEGRIIPAFAKPFVAEPPDILVIDEASMVGVRLMHDIERGLRQGSDDMSILRSTQILAVGDNAQLPPVKDTWGYPLHAPDAALTEVLRQAADSPVLRMATRIRTTGNPGAWLQTDAPADTRLEIRTKIAEVEAAAWVREAPERRIVLCYTNATRGAVNRLVRAPWAAEGKVVAGKDRLICLANSKGFVNGDILPVRAVSTDAKATVAIRAQVDAGATVLRATVQHPADDADTDILIEPFTIGGNAVDIMLANGQMRRGMTAAEARRNKPVANIAHVDYGFALTIHKSQGSQWPEVMVLIDHATVRLVSRNPAEAQRLLYTACTRASERLVVGRLA